MKVVLREPSICEIPCHRTIVEKTIGVEIGIVNGNYSKIYRGIVVDKPESQKKMENHFTIIQNQETGGITMINNEYIMVINMVMFVTIEYTGSHDGEVTCVYMIDGIAKDEDIKNLDIHFKSDYDASSNVNMNEGILLRKIIS